MRILLLLIACLPLTRADDLVSYALVQREGRTVIQASTGDVIPWAAFSMGVDHSVAAWKPKQQPPVEAGIRLFQLPLWATERAGYWDNPFTSLDGEPVVEPRPHSWPEQVAGMLQLAPDARFIMRFSIIPDTAWRAAHPDHYPTINAHGGGMLKDGKGILPSLASADALAAAEQTIRDTVAWCERQPWRNRIVGYTLFVFGEGATEVALFNELFDDSPVMQDAFRVFAAEKYETDAALQHAWREPAVTLANVTVPTRDGWFAKKQELHLKHWPEPALVQRELDYFLLQKQLWHRYWSAAFTALQTATAARPVLKGADNLKQHMLGWLHNASFEADWADNPLDTYAAIMLATGELGAAPLLDHPGLDMIQTPGMYYNRAMGYAWEAEGLTDSLTLRGKVNFMEADMRTWVNRDLASKYRPEGTLIPDAGAFLTQPEVKAGFDRTLAWALSRNQMFYYCSVFAGNWWYHEPPIVEVMKRQVALISDTGVSRWEPTTDAICLVVDDNSPLYEDFSSGYQHIALQRQLEEGLALCGIPYRIHLLSDLALPNFPDYKCYLFPNLFRIDAETERLLRDKILTRGHVAIFGPATGINTESGLSADAATRLFGVEMELIDKTTNRRVILQDHGHPISDRLPTMTYGDTYPFGPLLVPKAQRLPAGTSVTPLGAAFYYYFFDRPGPFIHDFADHSVIFSPAVPMPPQLLREAARHAGCHVWSEEDAVIHASADFVSLHTARGGDHTIHLPGTFMVQPLGTDDDTPFGPVNTITLTVKPPATHSFRLHPPPQP